MKLLLTCLDASPRAAHILAAAVDLARRTGARLALFRSVGIDPELRRDILGMSSDEIAERMLSRAKADITAMGATVPSELLHGVYAQIGTPCDAICRKAKELDCDLIVIGSHGYDVLDRVLGTTAAKVVNHADRSVLVIR